MSEVTVVCAGSKFEHKPVTLAVYRRSVTHFGAAEPIVTWNWEWHRATGGGPLVETGAVDGPIREWVQKPRGATNISPSVADHRLVRDHRKSFDRFRCPTCRWDLPVNRDRLHELLEQIFADGAPRVGLSGLATMLAKPKGN